MYVDSSLLIAMVAPASVRSVLRRLIQARPPVAAFACGTLDRSSTSLSLLMFRFCSVNLATAVAVASHSTRTALDPHGAHHLEEGDTFSDSPAAACSSSCGASQTALAGVAGSAEATVRSGATWTALGLTTAADATRVPLQYAGADSAVETGVAVWPRSQSEARPLASSSSTDLHTLAEAIRGSRGGDRGRVPRGNARKPNAFGE